MVEGKSSQIKVLIVDDDKAIADVLEGLVTDKDRTVHVCLDNQNYYYAAQAVRNAAMIAEIYNREDYFIISEQAAYLYSKINLYLEASQILEDIDKKKSVNFKYIYIKDKFYSN